MSNWSHTRLSAFRTCPWRYSKLYLEGYNGEPIPAFEAGKELHRLVAEYGEHCYAKSADEDESYAKVIASTTDDANLQKTFLRFCEQWTWDFSGVLGREGNLFEQWHEYDLGGDDLFRCRIDFLRWLDRDAGELGIVDFKSGGWSQPFQPAEAPIQLKLYALVMARELGEQVGSVHARIEFLGGCMNWSYDLDGFDLDETEEWLRVEVAKVKATEMFLAEPGPHCANCSCRTVCTYGYACEVDQLVPEQIIQELDVLNAKRAAYEEALKRRIEDFGPHTDLRGRTWGWHEGKECFDVPNPEKYAVARREAKLKPWGFVSWNQSALRKDSNREPLRSLLEEKPRERRWGAKVVHESS